MTAIFGGLFLKVWPYLAAVVAAAVGAFGIYAKGKKDQAAKQEHERLEAREIGDKVDNDVGAMPMDAKRKEASKWARK